VIKTFFYGGSLKPSIARDKGRDSLKNANLLKLPRRYDS